MPRPSPSLCPKCQASFTRKDSMVRHLKKCTGATPEMSASILPPFPTFVPVTTATPEMSAQLLPSERLQGDVTPWLPWRCPHYKVDGEPCLRLFGSENNRASHESLHHLGATCSLCGVMCRGGRVLNLHRSHYHRCNPRRPRSFRPPKLNPCKGVVVVAAVRGEIVCGIGECTVPSSEPRRS